MQFCALGSHVFLAIILYGMEVCQCSTYSKRKLSVLSFFMEEDGETKKPAFWWVTTTLTIMLVDLSEHNFEHNCTIGQA